MTAIAKEQLHFIGNQFLTGDTISSLSVIKSFYTFSVCWLTVPIDQFVTDFTLFGQRTPLFNVSQNLEQQKISLQLLLMRSYKRDTIYYCEELNTYFHHKLLATHSTL